jgi:hypothetical protein
MRKLRMDKAKQFAQSQAQGQISKEQKQNSNWSSLTLQPDPLPNLAC